MVLSLEQTKTNQAAEIEKLNKRVKKLKERKKRTHGLKSLYKVGLSTRLESYKDEEGLGAQEGRRIKDQDLFGVYDLDGDEVFVDVTTGENVEQAAIVAESVKGIAAATTPYISKDELTLAQTLMEIKAKPKAKAVTIQEPSEFRTTSPPQLSQPPHAKDKEVVRKLKVEMKAKMDEEEMIAREKNEANRAIIKEWDDVQATIDADRQKYFAAKRAEEIRNKPPTKEQQKSLKCTYMKNIAGFKKKVFKGKSFDDIKKMFDKVYKRVNTFVDMNTKNVEEILKKTQTEVTKSSSKRARQELEEGKKSYFKIIRADGNSQNYLTFETVQELQQRRLRSFKEYCQGKGAVKVNNWKLFDSCGVYCVTTKTMMYYLLVKKMYLFRQYTTLIVVRREAQS
nr:hypothetical protein [Tanacetum cinerariifolium]